MSAANFKILVNFDPCGVLEVRLTSFPYNTIQYSTVRYGTARRKPYTINPRYKFDDNVDAIDE
jgi:hypothetical protein